MRERISTARLIALLVFRPSAFIGASVDYAINHPLNQLDEEREKNLRKSFEKQNSRAVATIRRQLGRSFAIVFGAIAAAITTGRCLAWLNIRSSATIDSVLEYGGIAILLWATLGRADWSVQTMDGDSLPERVDLAVYNWLYVVGSFSLALPIAW